VKFKWGECLPAPIIGVDEAGIGCLAGRVYAAAVIIQSKKDLRFYTDSKVLSEKRREELFVSIQTHHKFSIAFATVREIDELNILWASHLAMKRAVEGLGVSSGHILIDGRYRIRNVVGFEQTPVIGGDLLAKPIGAASILAKVSRDRYVLNELAKEFPNYDFEKHKGYGTELHRKKIKEFGPCREHRKSFGGVKEFWPAGGMPDLQL